MSDATTVAEQASLKRSPRASSTTPSPAEWKTESPLLFSMQFYLDTVDLRLPAKKHTTSSRRDEGRATEQPAPATLHGGDFLTGFQLLQYEIVLFDAVERSSFRNGDCGGDARHGADEANRVVMNPQHGKSCLFEADADHVAVDLQRECDAPLALLIMQQDHGKARLVAFASIPMELHVGLLRRTTASNSGETVSMNTEMRFRVCEWASSSGTWELKDHMNRVVGSATGAATLSCLGRTLAPHIVNAIGLQVGKIAPSHAASPIRTSSQALRESSASLASNGKLLAESSIERQQEQGMATSENQLSKMDHSSADNAAEKDTCQKADMAVQCDEECIHRNGSCDRPQQSFASRRNHHASQMIHIESKTNVHSIEQPQRKSTNRHRAPTAADRRHSVHRAEPDRSVFPRELPPPLFFQKPKKRK